MQTLLHSNPSKNLTQAKYAMHDTLVTAMYAMQTMVTTTIGSTPGAIAFSRDMFLNVLLSQTGT